MARQNIDFVANLKLNLDAKMAEFDEIEKRVKSIAEGMKFAPKGGQRQKEASQILQDMEKLKSKDTSAMNHRELLNHEKEMFAIKQRYFKLINGIAGAEIAGLATTEEQKKRLEEINTEYANITRTINTYLKKLQDIEDRSSLITKSIKETANLTGISEATLTSPEGLQRSIDSRTKMDGTPRYGEEETVKRLLELQKLYNDENFKGLETLEKWNQESQVYLETVKNATDTAGKLRQEKTEIHSKIIDTNHAAGKISDTEKEVLHTSNEQLDTEQKITEEKKKQQGIDSSASTKVAIEDAKKLAKQNKHTEKSFLGKVTAATLYYAALRNLRRIITSVLRVVKELDKSITEVAMVTNMSREQAWGLVDAYQNLAREVGSTTSEIAKLSVFFFRQGRSAKDALELTKVAATAAKVAAIDATESANFLTSAINGFGMAANQAMEVSDRFAALGASSASSYQEMAIALSKVAPVAKTAGVGIDFMMGILAKGIETTREAPENIGTAFKTVFARMTQIRQFGATLDDSVSVNQVENALKQAGVALRDATGNFRNMEDVLIELGGEFETLTRNQQAYIATALAGTRQQSRLLAVMQNFDRTMELVNVSMTASGATLAQHAMYADGLQASLARLTTAWEKLILMLSDSEGIVAIIDTLANALNLLGEEFDRNGDLILKIAGFLLATLVPALIIAKLKIMGAAKAVVALKAAAFPLIAILAAVVGYFLLRNKKTEFERLAEESRKLSANIKQNQVDLYNFTKQANDIYKLQQRYQELERRIIKTREEAKEMRDIASQIQKISQEDHAIDIKVDVSVTDAAQLVIDALLGERNKALEESIELGQKRIELLVGSGLGGLTQDQANYLGVDIRQALGIDNILNSIDEADLPAITNAIASALFGREDFLTADAEKQAQMLEVSANNIDLYIKNQLELQKAMGETAKATENIKDIQDEIKNVEAKGLSFRGKIEWDAFDNETAKNILDRVNSELERTGVIKTDESFAETYLRLLNEDLENAMIEEGQFLQNLADLQMITGQEILEFVDGFEKMLSGSLTPQQTEKFWEDFMGLGETAQKSITNNIEALESLYVLGAESLKNIIEKDIRDSSGQRTLTADEKVGIARILSENGFNESSITWFFRNITDFTVDSISDFLSTIENESQRAALGEDFFNLLTGNASPQKFMDEIEKAKNSVSTLLDLQQKYQKEGLSAAEFSLVREMLGAGDLLDDFFSGTLTAEAFSREHTDALKNNIAEAMAFTIDRINNLGEDADPGLLRSLQNELLMYERLLADIDFLIFDTNMEEFYQSQIDFIQELNAKKQEEIDLEQKRLDMNRSMLSLNRQIAALERDTSFGAQARLEDLRLTRSQEAAQREAFIMDMIANQQISDLQNKLEQSIANNTARSADGIWELVDLARGRRTSTFQARTGVSTTDDISTTRYTIYENTR